MIYFDSHSDEKTQVLVDIINKSSLSTSCKVFRIVSKDSARIMNDNQLRISVRNMFRNNVSLNNPSNLNNILWGKLNESWCSYLFTDTKDVQ